MDNNIKEVWKDIVGYEGCYKVSNYGNVKSVARKRMCNGVIMPIKERNIALVDRGSGYLAACLYKDGKKKLKSVHRIVAEAFIPNPGNRKCIDHIDGSRNNNFYLNLRWCNYKENNNNPITLERNRKASVTRGIKRGKAVFQYNMNGEFLKEWANSNQAGNFLGIAPYGIIKCCKGEYRQFRGYRWSFNRQKDLNELPANHKFVKVAKLDKCGNILAVYNSIKEAAECTANGRVQDISRCALGKIKSASGYKWIRL